MNIISPAAEIGENVKIGHYSVISDGVSIGSDVSIGNNVTIYAGAIIGNGVFIESNAVVGRQPRPAKTSTVKIKKDLPPVRIGAGTTVGAGAVLYAGTVIGSFCLIGDTATVREDCSIGDYAIVGTGVIVENSVSIGQRTKIQSGSYITAYTTIEDNCFIAPMVTTTNDNFMGRTEERFKLMKGANIKRGARVGGGSILLPGVNIAEESFIAAGAVVTKDTQPEKMYKGIPASFFRNVPADELLTISHTKDDVREDNNLGIPLLDLKKQYESIKGEIDEAVLGVLASGQYVLGPNVKAFEKEIAGYCGTDFAVSVANGTDALILILDAYGIGPGDEVITTPYSFFATAEAISRAGATPVFVDIDERTYNIDVSLIEDKITARTKAIIPVHLFGQMAMMNEIMEIANRNKLIVIEDACQAIGASYKNKKSGSWGHAACFSFFPTKNLGGYGDGGLITTNDKDFAERVKILRVHGSRRRYYNEAIGYNSRLDELQAAILRVKLKYIDKWNETRRKIANKYDSSLQETSLRHPFCSPECYHVYHLYIVRHEQRDKIVNELKESGISCGVYYPVPLHLQDAYQGKGYTEGSLPVVEQMSKETFAIPLYPELTDLLSDAVIENIKEVLNGLGTN